MKTINKKYKFTVVASDIVILSIIENKLQALLIKMKKAPYFNFWAAPGGLVKPNESVDSAAKRILKEKAGVKDVYLEQLHTFGDVNRDPFGRVVSVSYYALIPNKELKIKTSKEYINATWFAIDDLPQLAYDHKKIIKFAAKKLQQKLASTNIAYSLLPKEFTLSELQNIYEDILQKKIDKRNFRKKILSLGIVKKTEKKNIGQAHRPASLYTFTSKKLKNVSIL